jgi:hypothetical protein
MLSEALTKYIDLHLSLGFKFRTQRLLLRNFVSFAEAHGDEFVQVARVLDWAGRAPSPPQRRNRLFTVRRCGASHNRAGPDTAGRSAP